MTAIRAASMRSSTCASSAHAMPARLLPASNQPGNGRRGDPSADGWSPKGGPKAGPDGRLYVTTEITKSVTVIDPGTNQVVSSLPTDQIESHMIAITSDGKRIYTSNVHVGTVSAIDVASGKVIAVIPVSPHAQRISISRDDRYVFTADQTKPRLAVIDTATNRVTKWISLPALAYGTAPTLDGRWLLVTLPDLNTLGVVDLKTMKMVRQVAVGKYPQEVVARPDGKVAYVSCMNEGKV